MSEGGGLQSLDSALTVLHAMARFPGPVTLTELARSVNMPASKVHRYLASFATAGLVGQTSRSGKYDLGPAALQLGLAAMARQDIINRTADALPDLCAQTGLTALLSVWGNAGPTVVRWERAAGFIVTTLGLGTTMPLIGSATGQVFLAHSPVAVIKAKLTAEGAAYKDSVVQDLIAQVHSAGFGCVAGDLIPGLAAVSAPVLNSQNHIEAAVTLISTDSAIVSKDCPQVSALKAFCAGLSVQMPV